MNYRTQLNQQHYQQAVQFAEQFATEDKQAWLAENIDRQQFEQAQFARFSQKTARKHPLVSVIIANTLVILSAAIYYWQSGRYTALRQGEQAFQQFQQQKQAEDSEQRNNHYIVSLQNQLRQDRNNGELWFELGQAYSLNNDFESALHCFDNAQRLLGRKASILGAMATADYYQHKQTLSQQGKAWLAQSLEQDPKESASLLLLASDAFLHSDFKQAIYWWENVLEGDNQSIDRRAVIRSMQMAQERLDTIK